MTQTVHLMLKQHTHMFQCVCEVQENCVLTCLTPVLCALCDCSLGGDSEQYSMYPSNRVKRRPAPYEVELDEGRRILDLYKYGKTHFCCVLLSQIQSPSSSPLSFIH